MDITFSAEDILKWSFDKQEAVKARLWKEFGLYQYFTNDFMGECDHVTEEDYAFLLNDFNIREHFVVTMSHKTFIMKVFNRFRQYFESVNLKEKQISKHDDSKLTSFLEIVGYTQRWIWNEKTDIWKEAWKHHYTSNSHHPEYYVFSDEKGQKVQSDMEYFSLVESVVDMIACRWERTLSGWDDVSTDQLLDIEEHFLNRYTIGDRERVKKLLENLFSKHYEEEKEV